MTVCWLTDWSFGSWQSRTIRYAALYIDVAHHRVKQPLHNKNGSDGVIFFLSGVAGEDLYFSHFTINGGHFVDTITHSTV